MSDTIEIKCGNKTLEPTRGDVWVLSGWPKDKLGRSGSYWHVLYQLLLAGFCLLISTNALGQEFRITERSTFKITERINETNATDAEYYAIMFTAKWCGPCQSYKSSGRLDRLKARFATTVVDIDEQPEWKSKVSLLPSFWLADKKTRTKVKSWSGITDVETIENEVKRIRTKTVTRTEVIKDLGPSAVITANDSHPSQHHAGSTAVVRFFNPSLFGQTGTSHESRETLIRHLLNDGIHRGRWTMQALNSMSDDALNAAHNQDHGWNQ